MTRRRPLIRPLFQSFQREHMDVSLRNGRDQTVRILERPGAWMNDAALADLSADLRKIADSTLAGRTLDYGVFSGERAHLSETIITLVCRSDGTPIAFNALAIITLDTTPEPTRVLHLGLVMVDPSERSSGMSWVLYGLTCFLVFVRNQFRPIWVSNVSQVPAVIGMVSEMFSDVWPKPDAERCKLNHLLIARRIMEGHRHVFGVGPEADFDEGRFVIERAYTGGSDELQKTWDEVQKHRKGTVNAFCETTLDYARGDDVLQVGQIDIAALRRYLRRDVPAFAVFGVASAAVFIVVQRLMLPVLHWFDTSRPFSILRAARDPSAPQAKGK